MSEKSKWDRLSKAQVILGIIIALFTVFGLLKGFFVDFDLFDFGDNTGQGKIMHPKE